jgi:hypothetical protein
MTTALIEAEAERKALAARSRIEWMFSTLAEQDYIGEPVSILQHSWQARRRPILRVFPTVPSRSWLAVAGAYRHGFLSANLRWSTPCRWWCEA